jgi:hypothetical protein
MKLDFKFEGTRYMLNFDNFGIVNGVQTLELRVYNSLDVDSLYASSAKEIKDGKIVWHDWDESHIPKSAQAYCDRIMSLKVFA